MTQKSNGVKSLAGRISGPNKEALSVQIVFSAASIATRELSDQSAQKESRMNDILLQGDEASAVASSSLIAKNNNDMNG